MIQRKKIKAQYYISLRGDPLKVIRWNKHWTH